MDAVEKSSFEMIEDTSSNEKSEHDAQAHNKEEVILVLHEEVIPNGMSDGIALPTDTIDHAPLTTSSTVISEFDIQSQPSLAEAITFHHRNTSTSSQMKDGDHFSEDDTDYYRMSSSSSNASGFVTDMSSLAHLPEEKDEDQLQHVSNIVFFPEPEDDSVCSKDKAVTLEFNAGTSADPSLQQSFPETDEEAKTCHTDEAIFSVAVEDATTTSYDLVTAASSVVESGSNSDMSSQHSFTKVEGKPKIIYDNIVGLDSELKEVVPSSSSTIDSKCNASSSLQQSPMKIGEAVRTQHEKSIILTPTEDVTVSSIDSTSSALESDTPHQKPLTSVDEGERKTQDNTTVLNSELKDVSVSWRDDSSCDDCVVAATDPPKARKQFLQETEEGVKTSHDNGVSLISESEVKEGAAPINISTSTNRMLSTTSTVFYSCDSESETYPQGNPTEATKTPEIRGNIFARGIKNANVVNFESTRSLDFPFPEKLMEGRTEVSGYETPLTSKSMPDHQRSTSRTFAKSLPDCHTDTSRLFCYPPSQPLPEDDSVSTVGLQNCKSDTELVINNAEVFHNIEDRPMFQKIRKGAVTVMGGALVGVGIPLIPTPVPGALFIASGLSLLGTEYPKAQEFMDKGVDSLSEFAGGVDSDDSSGGSEGSREKARAHLAAASSTLSDTVDLNLVCGIIVPSKEEVQYVVNATVEKSAAVGKKVNRTLKSFVKGAVLPAANFFARRQRYNPDDEVRYGDVHEAF